MQLKTAASGVRTFALGLSLGVAVTARPRLARAEVASLTVGSSLFVEPSSSSKLTVIEPSAGLEVRPAEWLGLSVHYDADIVSGATESLKGGPLSPVDIVTSATHFEDARHVFSGGFVLRRENTEVRANYAHGSEHDYRSNALAVSASTTFLQKNTELSLGYARGFDRVCTSAFAAEDAPSVRLPLDSSTGCFKAGKDRATRDISLDDFQFGWTQSWTPVFATQLVLSGALQHGFLENPYRAVVIAPAGDQALENHPDNRARAAVALRAKLYVKSLKAALSGGVRIYRDTWDIWGQTYEFSAERFILPSLRVLARGRYYRQSGALFWSDDYTGGEPENGPRGQYWTGDRELSPLSSLLFGGRAILRGEGRPGARMLGVLLGLEGAFSLDVIKTKLDEFTWGGTKPDDTLSILATLSARAEF